MSGCTAVVGLLTSSKVIVANAGDSRAIISCKGVAKALSYDHKPQNPGTHRAPCRIRLTMMMMQRSQGESARRAGSCSMAASMVRILNINCLCCS